MFIETHLLKSKFSHSKIHQIDCVNINNSLPPISCSLRILHSSSAEHSTDRIYRGKHIYSKREKFKYLSVWLNKFGEICKEWHMETIELSWSWPYVKSVQHMQRWKEKIKTNAELISPDSEERDIITSKVVMDLQQQTKKTLWYQWENNGPKTNWIIIPVLI